MEKEKVTYPIGTPVEDIRNWDRSTKVSFACRNHPEKEWRSKEPGWSSWFPTRDGQGDPCGCKGTYVTTAEYTA